MTQGEEGVRDEGNAESRLLRSNWLICAVVAPAPATSDNKTSPIQAAPNPWMLSRMIACRWLNLALVPCLLLGSGQPIVAAEKEAPGQAAVDFSRDVRPILSRHCFKCHGPDDAGRQAELRLDVREVALRPAESLSVPIVPGQPKASELVRRITSDDADEVMPPSSANHPLSNAEKAMLTKWIAAGAEYRPHWAFVEPVQLPPPAVKQKSWPANPIDHFVLARLEDEGLAPSPAADKHTLVRRVYFDLVGLPPTPEEADAFLNDPSADAYEKMVDRALASPRYGERFARRWLDLARYADTNGYEKDRVRSIWPYRDWVIGALNADLPFDRFTIEQLAGDMLPGATPEQRTATGFHRNTMLNEEGGIDPQEFRFYATVDRTNTTATTWLGLTLGCAQCHTHKYDPIPHAEYYRMLALVNNADEPELDVPQPALVAKRQELAAQIQAIEADLPSRFAVESGFEWQTPAPLSVASAGGATIARQSDGSLLLTGANPERDKLTLVFDSNLAGVTVLRLEALTDATLPSTGPGRTPHGNFVLSELAVEAGLADGLQKPQAVKFAGATADFAQDQFPIVNTFDGNPATGWAIHGPGKWNVNRSATFTFAKPTGAASGMRYTITLDQQHGSQHTLGKLRVSLGKPISPPADIAKRRRELLQTRFKTWLDEHSKTAARWTVLAPTTATANLALLTVESDKSVLASGDQSKRDVYDLKFSDVPRGVTAIRLEALSDDRLPRRGPGRVYYEGPPGDFYLSTITAKTNAAKTNAAKPNETPLAFQSATQNYTNGGHNAAKAIDADQQSGWSIDGSQGRPSTAVFVLAGPLAEAGDLALQLVFEKYYAAALGRFRISVTTDSSATAHAQPGEIEDLLARPAGERSAKDNEELYKHYLSVAPELAGARDEIKRLRDQMPAYPTTLVMSERPASYARTTHLHRRGEFLQPTDKVEPGVLSVLPPLPTGAPASRLAFAQWLVDGNNPLTGRVTMNRAWAVFFGRGLVRTSEDFGFQGELPSHPELLDWLAVELVRRGWSMKQMQRLIVTSATYRQSSHVTPALGECDPQNRLLARASRFRIEAELVRDLALQVSGLLSPKLGGPSVFPPQPPGVTSEGTYGPLAWNVSQGEDRYRRGLYTFSKRTAPYAIFSTFDAPSGEACLARREVSNTPLQALTLLNDAVYVEAAQRLGRLTARQAASGTASDEQRITSLFSRVLTRPPGSDELSMLLKFLAEQRARLFDGKLDAVAIAGPEAVDAADRAAWTLVARALLNLDETITRE